MPDTEFYKLSRKGNEYLKKELDEGCIALFHDNFKIFIDESKPICERIDKMGNFFRKSSFIDKTIKKRQSLFKNQALYATFTQILDKTIKNFSEEAKTALIAWYRTQPEPPSLSRTTSLKDILQKLIRKQLNNFIANTDNGSPAEEIKNKLQPFIELLPDESDLDSYMFYQISQQQEFREMTGTASTDIETLYAEYINEKYQQDFYSLATMSKKDFINDGTHALDDGCVIRFHESFTTFIDEQRTIFERIDKMHDFFRPNILDNTIDQRRKKFSEYYKYISFALAKIKAVEKYFQELPDQDKEKLIAIYKEFNPGQQKEPLHDIFKHSTKKQLENFVEGLEQDKYPDIKNTLASCINFLPKLDRQQYSFYNACQLKEFQEMEEALKISNKNLQEEYNKPHITNFYSLATMSKQNFINDHNNNNKLDEGCVYRFNEKFLIFINEQEPIFERIDKMHDFFRPNILDNTIDQRRKKFSEYYKYISFALAKIQALRSAKYPSTADATEIYRALYNQPGCTWDNILTHAKRDDLEKFTQTLSNINDNKYQSIIQEIQECIEFLPEKSATYQLTPHWLENLANTKNLTFTIDTQSIELPKNDNNTQQYFNSITYKNNSHYTLRFLCNVKQQVTNSTYATDATYATTATNISKFIKGVIRDDREQNDATTNFHISQLISAINKNSHFSNALYEQLPDYIKDKHTSLQDVISYGNIEKIIMKNIIENIIKEKNDIDKNYTAFLKALLIHLNSIKDYNINCHPRMGIDFVDRMDTQPLKSWNEYLMKTPQDDIVSSLEMRNIAASINSLYNIIQNQKIKSDILKDDNIENITFTKLKSNIEHYEQKLINKEPAQLVKLALDNVEKSIGILSPLTKEINLTTEKHQQLFFQYIFDNDSSSQRYNSLLKELLLLDSSVDTGIVKYYETHRASKEEDVETKRNDLIDTVFSSNKDEIKAILNNNIQMQEIFLKKQSLSSATPNKEQTKSYLNDILELKYTADIEEAKDLLIKLGINDLDYDNIKSISQEATKLQLNTISIEDIKKCLKEIQKVVPQYEKDVKFLLNRLEQISTNDTKSLYKRMQEIHSIIMSANSLPWEKSLDINNIVTLCKNYTAVKNSLTLFENLLINPPENIYKRESTTHHLFCHPADITLNKEGFKKFLEEANAAQLCTLKWSIQGDNAADQLKQIIELSPDYNIPLFSNAMRKNYHALDIIGCHCNLNNIDIKRLHKYSIKKLAKYCFERQNPTFWQLLYQFLEKFFAKHQKLKVLYNFIKKNPRMSAASLIILIVAITLATQGVALAPFITLVSTFLIPTLFDVAKKGWDVLQKCWNDATNFLSNPWDHISNGLKNVSKVFQIFIDRLNNPMTQSSTAQITDSSDTVVNKWDIDSIKPFSPFSPFSLLPLLPLFTKNSTDHEVNQALNIQSKTPSITQNEENKTFTMWWGLFKPNKEKEPANNINQGIDNEELNDSQQNNIR